MNYRLSAATACLRNGLKATIKRTTLKQQGWYITETKNFHKVCTGHTVRYYPKDKTPFYNLYRITSEVGTPDFVIHSVGAQRLRYCK